MESQQKEELKVPQEKARAKVFVSGCYDLLHSGHVEFFRQAAQYGDLYVGIGSDKTIEGYKHHKTIYSEQERLFMVKAIRYVKDAFINTGDGILDFLPTLDIVKPDILVVNEDGGSDAKKKVCEERGMQYIVLQRVPQEGLKARSSTDLKKTPSQIPTRLDLAGTWIDQPYVSQYAPGWAITISLEPTFEIRERCGLSTSTRNMIKKICRHWYDKRFWPEKIETCYDEQILSWLEQHLVMIPMEPRRLGCSVVADKDITEPKVKALAKAADDCWNAIMTRNLAAFAAAYQASFEAQVAMFPAMIQGCVTSYIDAFKDQVLAYKMPGAGGGGYLACVVEDAGRFVQAHKETIRLTIRRPG